MKKSFYVSYLKSYDEADRLESRMASLVATVKHSPLEGFLR